MRKTPVVFDAGTKNRVTYLLVSLVAGIGLHWLIVYLLVYNASNYVISDIVWQPLQLILMLPVIIPIVCYVLLYANYCHSATSTNLRTLKKSAFWCWYLLLEVGLEAIYFLGCSCYVLEAGAGYFSSGFNIAALNIPLIPRYTLCVTLVVTLDVIIFCVGALFFKPEYIQNTYSK